jgi:Zn finger protein HypA/HybF involved in hydrogenase expression
MGRSTVERALGAPSGADCATCRGRLHRNGDGQWVHSEGGAWLMKCGLCGHSAAPPPPAARCPKCGSINAWSEDHRATAVVDY